MYLLMRTLFLVQWYDIIPFDKKTWGEEQIEMIKNMVNGGHVQGYLFRCLHCGKHFLYFDVD